MNKIKIENKLEAYHYMSFLSEAIQKEEDFKYTAIHQLDARLSGKTTSDNIELVRAVLWAYRKKVSLVAFIFRMRHKDTQ